LFATGGICDPGDSHENDIILYAKIEGRKEHIVLDTLSYSSYKVQMSILVPKWPILELPRQAKDHENHARCRG
jgi:reelin